MNPWSIISSLFLLLKPAFTYSSAFFYACVCIMGFMTRLELKGVSSFVRCLYLKPQVYRSLLHLFESPSVKLETLRTLWCQLVFKVFKPFFLLFNGRILLVADAIKIPKEGRKMPGVKSQHQESNNNSKPEFIMGHIFQCIGLLVQGLGRIFAVPLVSSLDDGVKFGTRDNLTLLDKLILAIARLGAASSYLVVDNAYCAWLVARLLVDELNSQLVSRVRSNGIAFEPAPCPKGKKKKGRPKKYGKKVRLQELFASEPLLSVIVSMYGQQQQVKIWVRDLYWRSYGKLVRYVGVLMPNGNTCIFLCTDLEASAEQIIAMYSYRMKIEVSFKAAVKAIGAYAYHFWAHCMEKVKKGQGTQYVHRKSSEVKRKIKEKLKSYELFVQLGLIAQGLLQYLSLSKMELIYKFYGGWNRTQDLKRSPTEEVVMESLRHAYISFLTSFPPGDFLGEKLRKMIAWERLFWWDKLPEQQAS